MGKVNGVEVTDLEMMRNSKLWPLDQALPLKRKKDGGWETAMLVHLRYENRYFFVPDATIFEAVVMGDPRVIKDPDLEAIIADGWIVD